MLSATARPDNSGKSRYAGKKIIYVFLILLFFASKHLPQEKDSLIQLYPGLGDILDLFDKTYFALLQNIEGFKFATFYIRDDKQFVSKISFIRHDILYDTTAIQTLAVLEAARFQIEQTLLKNDTTTYTQREAVILYKDGKVFSGNIEMFSKKNLYLSNAQDLQSEEENKLKLSIPVSQLDSILYIGESDVLYSTAVGTIAGAAFGALIGYAMGDDEAGFFSLSKEEKAFGLGLTLGVVGGLSGLLVGLSNSEDDINIKINDQLDLLKLKDYAKYNFNYDDSAEQDYKAIMKKIILINDPLVKIKIQMFSHLNIIICSVITRHSLFQFVWTK